jgi:hypothetical protein
MNKEEKNPFEELIFPHIIYFPWPIESMSAMNDIQSDNTKLYYEYLGEENSYLKKGEIYEFVYKSYSPNIETKRRKVLATSIELPKEEQKYKGQKTIIRLEEFPKNAWKKVKQK